MIWQTRRAPLDLTREAAIMGILNVTPDSFSDGGTHPNPESAVDHALAMEADGAAIIDVGGESTRPGAPAVSADDEIHRILPVIERLRTTSDVLISIDTSKAAVARAAIAAGADIVNDVTGLAGDPAMAALAAETKVGVIIMHMRGTPRTMQTAPAYDDVVAEVREFLRQQTALALASGISPMAIALDPGIGFGKTPDHNRLLLENCDRLTPASPPTGSQLPIVIGVSRKSYLSTLVGNNDIADRFWPGVALTSFCRELGARVFRVHDVAAHHSAVRMTEAILHA
ncbi:MAG: dihydropteroate synthase [Chthoniobacterales bacterium]